MQETLKMWVCATKPEMSAVRCRAEDAASGSSASPPGGDSNVEKWEEAVGGICFELSRLWGDYVRDSVLRLLHTQLWTPTGIWNIATKMEKWWIFLLESVKVWVFGCRSFYLCYYSIITLPLWNKSSSKSSWWKRVQNIAPRSQTGHGNMVTHFMTLYPSTIHHTDEAVSCTSISSAKSESQEEWNTGWWGWWCGWEVWYLQSKPVLSVKIPRLHNVVYRSCCFIEHPYHHNSRNHCYNQAWKSWFKPDVVRMNLQRCEKVKNSWSRSEKTCRDAQSTSRLHIATYMWLYTVSNRDVQTRCGKGTEILLRTVY